MKFVSPKKCPENVRVLTLPASIKMLPLLRTIMRDIIDIKKDIKSHQVEFDKLYKNRRNLSWDDRKVMYAAEDVIQQKDNKRKSCIDELGDLGVIFSKENKIGFPTIVNNNPAVFVWQYDEPTIKNWQFWTEDDEERPIPEKWYTAKVV